MYLAICMHTVYTCTYVHNIRAPHSIVRGLSGGANKMREVERPPRRVGEINVCQLHESWPIAPREKYNFQR